MASIDLIVLGMLKKEPLSAYDMQKLVEARRISQWVKISTPSIYKKVLQLEDKGLITSSTVKAGRMPEKAVYALTERGEAEFTRLMREIAAQPVHFYLDFNAVIVNLASLPPDEQAACLAAISAQVQTLAAELADNLAAKTGAPDVPTAGLAVLRQQHALACAVAQWLGELSAQLPLAP